MLKKKINGTWNGVTTLKKKVNGAWSDCSTAKKKISGAWSIVWQRWNANLSLATTSAATSSYSFYATATAGGNILIKLSNRQSYDNGHLGLKTSDGSSFVFQMKAGETIYVDYIYTQSGNGYEASINIADLGYSINTTFLNLTSNSSGTASYTATKDFAGYLRFTVSNFNKDASSSYYGQLEISRIYTDSKIFYWNTITFINQ